MPNPNILFPAPVKIAGRNFWPKGEVRRWRAQVAGLPDPAPQSDDENWLTSSQVREFFGGVSHMWLCRRMNPERYPSKPKAAA